MSRADVIQSNAIGRLADFVVLGCRHIGEATSGGQGAAQADSVNRLICVGAILQLFTITKQRPGTVRMYSPQGVM